MKPYPSTPFTAPRMYRHGQTYDRTAKLYAGRMGFALALAGACLFGLAIAANAG